METSDRTPPEVAAFLEAVVDKRCAKNLASLTIQDLLRQVLSAMPSAWDTLRSHVKDSPSCNVSPHVKAFLPTYIRSIVTPYTDAKVLAVAPAPTKKTDATWDELFSPIYLSLESRWAKRPLADLAAHTLAELQRGPSDDHFTDLLRHGLCLCVCQELRVLAEPTQHLLTEEVVLSAWKAILQWCPVYSEILLAHISGEDSLAWILSSHSVLATLGLQDELWYTPPQEDAMITRLYYLPPFTTLPVKVSSESAHYDAMVHALAKATTLDDVTKVLTPADEPSRGLLRGQLFYHIYQCCFHGKKTGPGNLLKWVDTHGQRVLDISPAERVAYAFIAQGPIPTATKETDGLRHVMSVSGGTEMDIQLFAINAMVFILGCPRERCYYHTCCFNIHDFLHKTMGLGSDYSRTPKDCGYVFDQLKFRATGPFKDVRRHRSLNNALIWCGFAWAHTLFPQHHPSVHMLCSYVGDAQNSYAMYTLMRARAFYAVVGTDEILQSQGIHYALYCNLAMAEARRQMYSAIPDCLRFM